MRLMLGVGDEGGGGGGSEGTPCTICKRLANCGAVITCDPDGKAVVGFATCSPECTVTAFQWMYEVGLDGLAAAMSKPGATLADAKLYYEAHKRRLGLPPSFSGWDGVRK